MPDAPRKLTAANNRIGDWRAGKVPGDDEVLAFFNEIRMALEASGTSKVFTTLRSYCDLLFHEKIDRKPHYHRLFSASACLRLSFRENKDVSFDELYEAVFSAATLTTELYQLFDRFDLAEGKDCIFEFSKAIVTGLFRNLHEHSITCFPDVTTDGLYDLKKAEKLFGAPEVFVVAISFDRAPLEGQVAAKLDLLKEFNDQVGVIHLIVPITIR